MLSGESSLICLDTVAAAVDAVILGCTVLGEGALILNN